MKSIFHFQNLTPHGDARWIFETTKEVNKSAVESTVAPEAAASLAQIGAKTELSQLKKSLNFIDGIEDALVMGDTFETLSDGDIAQLESLLGAELSSDAIDAAEATKVTSAFRVTLEWARTAGTVTPDQLLTKFQQESLAAGVDPVSIEKLTDVDAPKTAENEAAGAVEHDKNKIHLSGKLKNMFENMSAEFHDKVLEADGGAEMRAVLIAEYQQEFATYLDLVQEDIQNQIDDDEDAEAAMMAGITGGQGAIPGAVQKIESVGKGVFAGDKNLGNFPKKSGLYALFSGLNYVKEGKDMGVKLTTYVSDEIAKYRAGGAIDIGALTASVNTEITSVVNELIPEGKEGDKVAEEIQAKYRKIPTIESGERTVEDQKYLIAKLKTVKDYLVGTKYETEYQEFLEGGGVDNFDHWFSKRKESMGMMEKLGLLFKQIGFWFKSMKGSFTGDDVDKKSATVTELQEQLDRAVDGKISPDEALDQSGWIINEESLLEKFDEKYLRARVEKKAILPENLKSGPAAEALHSLLGHDESFFTGYLITTEDLKDFSAEFGESFGDDSGDVFHSQPGSKMNAGDYFLSGNEDDPMDVDDLPKDSKYFEVEGTGGTFKHDYAFSGARAFFTWLHRQRAEKN